jgi:dolichyl-phosphate-mannose-protein mannosyltransferase
LLVESRFILIDSMLILFGLSAVTCFIAARRRTGKIRLVLMAASAILAGLCLSTKWTGLAALGLIGLTWLTDQIYHWKKYDWKNRLIEGAMLLALPFLVYTSVFWVHFKLLTHTGQGDAFMSQKFQSTLKGNALYDPTVHLSFHEKFIDLNNAMSQSEKSLLTATHPYGSKWSTWPLMIRPVYYWQGDTLANGRQGNIYLLGNPVVWWGILAVILGGALASSNALARLRRYRFTFGFLGAAYLVNFLPFMGIHRVMFLYHYLFGLIYSLAFAVILLGVLADWMHDTPSAWKFSTKRSRNIYLGVLGLALVSFIYFAPLSYGVPLSPESLAHHMWLKSWR